MLITNTHSLYRICYYQQNFQGGCMLISTRKILEKHYINIYCINNQLKINISIFTCKNIKVIVIAIVEERIWESEGAGRI